MVMTAGFHSGTLQFIKPFPKTTQSFALTLVYKVGTADEWAQVSCFSREGALISLQPSASLNGAGFFCEGVHQLCIGIYET